MASRHVLPGPALAACAMAVAACTAVEPPPTEVHVSAMLPGVTASIDDVSVVLGELGGDLVVDPPLDGHDAGLRLTQDEASIFLPILVSGDYVNAGLDRDVPVETLTVMVFRTESGFCHASVTSGTAGGTSWSGGIGGVTPGPCWPFAPLP